MPGPANTGCTVKQYANAEGVSRRSVYRWIQKQALTVRRTPGGGVRIVAPPPVTLSPTRPSPHPRNKSRCAH